MGVVFSCKIGRDIGKLKKISQHNYRSYEANNATTINTFGPKDAIYADLLIVNTYDFVNELSLSINVVGWCRIGITVSGVLCHRQVWKAGEGN